MNDQERQVISDIFQRLEQVADQPRDPEAERFIAERIRAQPYAPYAMAQAIVVQEQALKNLNEQVRALQAEIEDLRSRAHSGGFLSQLFGGGGREPERRPAPSFGQGGGSPWGQPAPGPQPGMGQGGPWGGQPGMQAGMQPGMGQPMGGGMMGGQPGMFGGQPRQGGGFLSSALTTAAGVAGGMMIANALSHAFEGGHNALSEHASALGGFGADNQPAGADAPGDYGGITDSLYQDASVSPDSQDQDFGDLGGDNGDGGDWA
jgi:uncharacterized protein